MEFQKITNFLNINSDNKDLSKFVTKIWIEVCDQSEENYNPNKEIRIKTSMLRSDLCDFSDVYIVVKGTITIGRPNTAKINKAIAFKNNAPFINCISKINGAKIDNAEDLNVVMPMYLNIVKIIKKTTGSLWNYYRDEPSESFKYKTSITGNTYSIGDGKEGYHGN